MLTFTVIAQPDDETLVDQVMTLPEQGGDIGRSDSCDICLPDSRRQISRRHVEIVSQGGHYFARDWSSNGLKINEEILIRGVEGQRQLSDGDILSIGLYRLLVSKPEAVQPQEMTQPPSPPLLTDIVTSGTDSPALTDNSCFAEAPASFLGETASFTGSRQLLQSGYPAGMAEGLAGINILADEILKEFNPEHLQHILRPWKTGRFFRESWWKLYCRYYEQLQRSGEFHIRLRELSLRAGGIGRGEP